MAGAGLREEGVKGHPKDAPGAPVLSLEPGVCLSLWAARLPVFVLEIHLQPETHFHFPVIS